MLTTWNSACGIAEYSRHLVEEFKNMGHKVLLLVNKASSNYEYKSSEYIIPVFGVWWWGEDSSFDNNRIKEGIEYFEAKEGKIDVVIIQYQSSLYDDKGLNQFVNNKYPIILVRHDSSWNKKHNLKVVTTISHNVHIEHTHYIPFPTIELIPKVFSFGMGRNDYDFIRLACAEIGIDFEGHDARKDGWLSEEVLFNKMSNADAIILWYNEVGIEGQSAALRTAISSKRPVIINDVDWFKDAPSFVHKVSTKEQLQHILYYDILHLDYIKNNSYYECAKKYLEVLNG